MDSSTDALEHLDGAAAALPPTAATAPCPLNDLPQNLHEYIHGLEKRVADLENALENFSAASQKNREAMKGLGAIVLSGPGKMFIAALPKEMQGRLQEFFGVTP